MIPGLLVGLACAASPQILHEFPAGTANSGEVYRISRAPCAKKCALQVQLISPKAQSAISLQWSPAPGKIEPLPDQDGRKGWSLGKTYALHARAIPALNGSLLWLTSIVGWEHLHRNHEVFAVVNGALKLKSRGATPLYFTIFGFHRSSGRALWSA